MKSEHTIRKDVAFSIPRSTLGTPGTTSFWGPRTACIDSGFPAEALITDNVEWELIMLMSNKVYFTQP